MSTINDGGPAFPHGPLGDSISGEDGRTWHQYPAGAGMTLRDWFAGQALVGTLSNHDLLHRADLENPEVPTRVVAAQWAYGVADAMLKARGK